MERREAWALSGTPSHMGLRTSTDGRDPDGMLRVSVPPCESFSVTSRLTTLIQTNGSETPAGGWRHIGTAHGGENGGDSPGGPKVSVEVSDPLLEMAWPPGQAA